MALLGVLLAVTAAALIFFGSYSLLTSRNLIRVLVSIEAMFNGVLVLVLLLAAISTVYASPLEPAMLVVFAVALTAVEVAVLTAIILLTYRSKGSIAVDKVRELKG